MEEKNKKANKSNKKFIIAAIIVIVICLAGWFIWNNIFRNYAAEVAAPIESVIAASGGVKQNSGGSAGRIADNTEPYYGATYRLKGDKQHTIEVIYKAAEQNGYKLTHASPQDRGEVVGAVADIYIDQWYFDETNKTSPYTDLKDGKIQLAFKIGDRDGNSVGGYTDIDIRVKLPSFKPN